MMDVNSKKKLQTSPKRFHKQQNKEEMKTSLLGVIA